MGNIEQTQNNTRQDFSGDGDCFMEGELASGRTVLSLGQEVKKREWMESHDKLVGGMINT